MSPPEAKDYGIIDAVYGATAQGPTAKNTLTITPDPDVSARDSQGPSAETDRG
jgi:hypothetical protein